jgi:hypothetical protein
MWPYMTSAIRHDTAASHGQRLDQLNRGDAAMIDLYGVNADLCCQLWLFDARRLILLATVISALCCRNELSYDVC